MPLVYLLSIVFVVMFLGTNTEISKRNRSIILNTGDFNQSGGNLVDFEKNSYSWEGTNYDSKEPVGETDIDTVEGVLIRTCRTLNTLSIQNRCASPNRENVIWGFVGSAGTKGNLLPVWNGTTTPAFSCANKNGFGRYLIQKAIPKKFISTNAFRYDFSDMFNLDNTDPCGYIDFVGK